MDAARVLRGEIAVEDLAFKIPQDGRIWNTKYPRPTAVAKVTGTCDYGHDLILKMPSGTLQLALVQAQIRTPTSAASTRARQRACPACTAC